jgi:hypothetical protein
LIVWVVPAGMAMAREYSQIAPVNITNSPRNINLADRVCPRLIPSGGHMTVPVTH